MKLNVSKFAIPLFFAVASSTGSMTSHAAGDDPASSTSVLSAPQRDGSHDFDFEIGTWKTHVSKLVHPLSGSSVWAQYDGTSVVSKVWNGRANLVELEADGPQGHLELASFRLYNPQAHQWGLNVASSRGGAFGTPTVGEFKDGRAEFYDQETFNDRFILVRFVISNIKADSCHFEQAFSADGGKTWEVNWIADDTRVDTASPRSSRQTLHGL